jgi:membrane-bound lytic murein transglycosylase B
LLAAVGYGLAQQDGVIGAETTTALRAYQRRKGLPADGHPSLQVLEALRTDVRS